MSSIGDLASLPAFEAGSDDLTVVIETPRGRRNKYKYDDQARAFRLSGVLPDGASFPYDFGFVPSTRAEDGDPLDVLVLLDEPAMPGCIVATRLIGAIEAEQSEGEKTERNDRLLAAGSDTHAYRHVRSLEDLRPGLLDEIEAFFVNYNRQRGRAFNPVGRRGPKDACALVEEASVRFRARKPK